MINRCIKYLVLLLLLLFEIVLAQQKNPTIYPYGGEPDKSRFIEILMKRIPLNFKKADFGEAKFDSLADFRWAKFYSLADFGWIEFYWRADFRGAQFDSRAYFRGAEFDSLADFRWSKFHSLADFGWAKFKNKAIFNSTIFDTQIDFRDARSDSMIDFSLAGVRDAVWIGILNSSELQRYDFMRTNLNAKSARIVLCGPVDLKIQGEKFKFLTLWDKLDYFSKKDIISTLKDLSFKEDKYKKERFELDYLFEKSTMYQVGSTEYAQNKWYRFQLWPKWIKSFFYYATMGLGYRPFRLAWWVFGLIISFAIFYFFKMKDSIDGYILKKFEMKESSGTKRKKDVAEVRKITRTESLMNCFYFSSMLLFSFRLKGEILTFFKLKEKKIIVGEYLLGLLIYIAFLTLAKSGSILNNLKSLFMG